MAGNEASLPKNPQHIVSPELQTQLAELQSEGVDVRQDDASLRASWSDQGGWAPANLPAAVAYPTTVEQVQTVMRWATKYQVPVVPKGAGTGVAGASTSTTGQLSLDMSHMNRIIEINERDATATVEPGVITKDLDDEARKHNLRYAPDPASYASSTIGGNIATNAGGLQCVKYGVTGESILTLDCVLANGELLHCGHKSIKGVTGYDLVHLIVGSEGTLAVVVGATVKLRAIPREKATIAAYFNTMTDAAKGVTAILASGVNPSQLEFVDGPCLEQIDKVHGSDYATRGHALILAETDSVGSATEVEIMKDAIKDLATSVETTTDPAVAADMVAARRLAYPSVCELGHIITEDIAVPRGALAEAVEAVHQIGRDHGVPVYMLGHAGDGNLHPLVFDNGTDEVAKVVDEIMRLAVKFDGTLSGEHGVGTIKLPWLSVEQSDVLRNIQRGIKKVFDPDNLLNPGKAI